MNKILIFTASTGGGHNQVALSLKNEFQARGYEVIKLDILKETSKVLDVLIADGYRVLANNLPRMYGGLYKISDRISINKPITSLFTKIASKRIFELIQENRPSLIIGTHPFIVNVVGGLKEKGKIKIPFISVVTDFQAHQTYVHEYVDAYITGSYYTGRSLINRGISKDRIYSYGIPIRREFLQNTSGRIGKKDKYFTILLMGGSMGVKSMRRVLKYLICNRYPLRIIAICGNNDSMRKTIERRYKDRFPDKKIVVYGYTNKIPELMDISDVIITKPGGLTSSEAIAKNIPMIIPYFIPGQEEENAEFLVNAGAAIKIDEIKEINSKIEELIDNPSKLQEMKENMKKMSNNYSIDNIVKLANRLIEQYRYEWGIANEG
jgi:processive 1,2-diacylglycerol beta-glucosyltransferase